MGKEVTRIQAVGWLAPFVVAILGGMIAAYVMVQNHDYRISQLEKTQRQQFGKLDAIDMRLQKIENSIVRIETILEVQAQAQEKPQAQVWPQQRLSSLRSAATQAVQGRSSR
jgi:TolA-binding protein